MRTSIYIDGTIANQLRQKIESLVIEYEDQRFGIRTSIGVHEEDGLFNINLLLQKVDKNLYLAKSAGKNRVIADTDRQALNPL